MDAAQLCVACWSAVAGVTEVAPGKSPAAEQSAEIVVYGERVNRTLRETASSVVVFTGDMIGQQPGADRLDDLLEQVPNVQIGNGSQGPAIRGQDTTGVLSALPAFLGGARSRVTLQVDGRAVGYNEFIFGTAPLWDVRQVEVFRSPQSVTQGRNSIAGGIFVRTKDPTADWQAGARAIAGTLETRQLSAFVSGPLVKDQFEFRIAGDWRRARPSSRIAEIQRGADPNRDDYEVLRAKLAFAPAALPDARMVTTFTHTRSQAPQIVGIAAPFRDRRDPFGFYGIFGIRVNALTSVLDLPLSDRLSSTTTFSFGDSHVRRYAFPGLGESNSKIRDASVESTARWTLSDQIQLTGGVHYLRSRLNQFIDLSAVIGRGDFRDRQHSLGLFSEMAIKPTPSVTITAGARYQTDSQHRTGLLGGSVLQLPIDFDKTFSAFLPKVSIAFDVTPEITAGAFVQRAYNPGGTTLNFDTGREETFGAEHLWSYEAFARARLADGRLRLSANLFTTTFRNAQHALARVFILPGGRGAGWAQIFNVPKARNYGLEASADWDLTAHLRVRGGIGLLRTRIVDQGNFTVPIEGNRFDRAPSFSGFAGVDWAPSDRLTVNASVRHSSGYFSDDLNKPEIRIGPSTRVDSRAAYDAGRVTLFAYARNLFDALILTQLTTPTYGTAAEPREIGIGAEARF